MQVDFKPGRRLGAKPPRKSSLGEASPFAAVANRLGFATSSATSSAKRPFVRRTTNKKRESLGAVRVNESDQSPGRRYLFVFGAGCIAASALIYLVNIADSFTQQLSERDNLAAVTPHFQTTGIDFSNLPKPIPQPTFRFDDDAIQTAALSEPAYGVQSPDDVPGAFTPQALADLIGPRDANAAQKQSLLDDINNAESSLPPLQGEQVFPHQTLELVDPEQSLHDDYKKVVTVEAGATFSGMLNDNGVARADLGAVESHDLVQRHLTRLKVGQKMTFTYDWDGTFKSLSVKVSRDTRVLLSKADDGYSIEEVHLPLEYERVVSSGTIEQSLYVAAEKANLKQTTIMNLADIFQWELDFSSDIRKGDHFSIVYDRLYRDGKYVGDGDILAAEFVRGNSVHRAVRYTGKDGKTAYYSPDGKAKGRTFMRHPVEIVRITSKFNLARMHPVLHQIRAHRGVDYGAPHGSPIRAVADGRITYAGNRNAYGKTVIIKHDTKRTTLYAHMSKIDSNSKVGDKIKRGEVIGYVGRTGRVTGTHLHYELRINGKHVDPLKVELPSPEPLAASELPILKGVSQELIAQMRSVNDPNAVGAESVARNDQTTN